MKEKDNVETAFCDFCGVRGDVVVSEQVQSDGVRICGPCASRALSELAKIKKVKRA